MAINISEETFKSWAKGPSATEKEKCDNAETAIRKAIQKHDKLSEMDVTIFPQGSYRNRTNVKLDSDVDICVRLNSTLFATYPANKTKTDYGHKEGSITFAVYKTFVQEAVEDYFGRESVTRGNKAFDIHANTYRVNADVVAALEHRRYTEQTYADGSHHYHSGIGFDSDSGDHIINWPNQHYDNGLKKHEETGRRYRKLVRILKRLRNEMQDAGVIEANNVASCLIEHLVWNVPNSDFVSDRYTDVVRSVLAHTFNLTRKDADCSEWGEVSELIYLFRQGKPWTRQQAHDFLSAAWNHIGFD